MTPDQIASVSYGARRVFRELSGYPADPDWAEVTDFEKFIISDGIASIVADPNISTKELHTKWCFLMLQSGFSWGPVEDLAQQQLPQLVAWEELPAFNRKEAEMTCAIIQVLTVD